MSLPHLRAASPHPAPCKICGEPAPPFGAVDFHKCCEEPRGHKLPLSGVPIYYRRCGACGFLFTDAFDDWSENEFKTHIYNDEYIRVDPDYLEVRAVANANAIARIFAADKSRLRVLDYGGGNGLFASLLREAGFAAAETYDPFAPAFARPPDGRFDVLTCFETLEHLPQPVGGLEAMAQLTAEPGIVVFSTLLQPDEFDRIGLDWWYVGPRNGHISIFSRSALALAWKRFGFRVGSFNHGLHAAYRQLPGFAAHLVP